MLVTSFKRGNKSLATFACIFHDPWVLLLSRVQHLDVVQTSQVREPPGILFEVRGHGEQGVFQRAAGLSSVTPPEILHHKNGSSWWTHMTYSCGSVPMLETI